MPHHQPPAEPRRTPRAERPTDLLPEWDAFMARLERALDERVAVRVEARLAEMRPAPRRWSRRRLFAVAASATAAVFLFVASVSTTRSGPDLEWQGADRARVPRPVEIGRPVPAQAPVPPVPPAQPVPPERPAPPARPAPPQRP